MAENKQKEAEIAPPKKRIIKLNCNLTSPNQSQLSIDTFV